MILSLENGLYEQIVNEYLSQRLEAVNTANKHLILLDDADSNDYLSQYLYRVLAQGLSRVKPEKDGKSRIEIQTEICNEIIQTLTSRGISTEKFKVSEPAQKLISVMDETLNYSKIRPDTPLVLGALLTGTRQDPSLVSQLKKEILSSDRVDILCSFIMWSGIRVLKEAFEIFTAKEGNLLRVITTSYMGATQVKAIEFLAGLPNTSIKISYDTRRTRLHAKAYLFERKTGFSSAYIGSSNISNAALTDGLEWNIKISQYEQPYQWDKTIATFDTYWNDNEFEVYKEGDREILEKALKAEKYDKNMDEFVMPNFDLAPYPFQKEILETIWAERQIHHRKKHLIVAATGTGKTMVAAFDFKRFRKHFIEDNGREPNLMFVAHREEILKQSLYTFRTVLRDQNFGEMMVGGYIPEHRAQVFVSIQTYNSKKLHESISSGYYDYIVVDEFHHAAAPSYRRLLNHVEPGSLLGLTATPERADNLNIKKYFDDHITAEIRLPDAIDRKLLCPFQYFGITDSVNYSGLKWQRGGYLASELTNVYTVNDIRAKLIASKTVSIVLDIKKVKGLGFCVSKVHAEYMSAKFNEYGIPSEFLTSDSDKETRATVQKRLLTKEINFIFVVDLYNEGVDIPEVDTVLFLRPTESLTVFLQQLGRGLRLSDEKNCLTVLDFVGQANNKYRYDLKFRALIENTRQDIGKELEEGFPHLPAGCSIELERKSRDFILENIKQAINVRRGVLVNRAINFTADTGKELNMANFIEYYNLELDDIYRKFTWQRLLAEAGLVKDFIEADEKDITKGLRRLQHISDIEYIDCILHFIDDNNVIDDNLLKIDEYYLNMFVIALWKKKEFSDLNEAIERLTNNPNMFVDTVNFFKYRRENIISMSRHIELPYLSALALHSSYTQAELLAGLGYFSITDFHTVQSGVLYIRKLKTDIFFITLNKNEKDYSPTTMYHDYAISEDLFHWQSQSITKIASKAGQRYISQRTNGNTVLLFVRENRTINSLSQPYHFLGPVEYVRHEGEKPINIVWRMKHPIPAHLLRETKRLVVG